MNNIWFTCGDKRYCTDLDLFKKKSPNYFGDEATQLLEIEIPLVNNFEANENLFDEPTSIMIQYIEEKDEIKLTNDTVVTLKYLSTKFNFTELHQNTEKYLEENYKEVIDYFLNCEIEGRNINFINEYEKLISSHLTEYIDDYRLVKMQISGLYRILNIFNIEYNKNVQQRFLSTSPENQSNEQINEAQINFTNKIIELIIRCAREQGTQASILLSVINLANENLEYLMEKYRHNSGYFDFNFIKPMFIEYLNYSEDKKKESEAQRKKEIENLVNIVNEKDKELKDIRKEMTQMNKAFKQELEKIANLNKVEILRNQDENNYKLQKVYTNCMSKIEENKKVELKKIKEVINSINNKAKSLYSILHRINKKDPNSSEKLDHLIIWKDININNDENTQYLQEMTAISNVNIYPVETVEKALELIELKKTNKIKLITNGGEFHSGVCFGQKLILLSRKIIKSNFVCLVYASSIHHLNWITKMENVLFTNQKSDFQKYVLMKMEKNEILNFAHSLENKYKTKFLINEDQLLKFQ